MKNSIIYFLIFFTFSTVAIHAKPPQISDLKENDSIQVNVDIFANAIRHYQYIFSKDEVLIKEITTVFHGKNMVLTKKVEKVIGKLVLTKEEQTQVDRYLKMISTKDDRHNSYVEQYEIIHSKGNKVIETITSAVSSKLRKTKKKYITLSALKQRLDPQKQ